MPIGEDGAISGPVSERSVGVLSECRSVICGGRNGDLVRRMDMVLVRRAREKSGGKKGGETSVWNSLTVGCKRNRDCKQRERSKWAETVDVEKMGSGDKRDGGKGGSGGRI